MSTRPTARALASWLLLLVSLPACGDDSETGSGSGGGSPGSCGTLEEPVIFQLSEVTPAPGTVVDGLSVVHSFRVVDAPAAVASLAFQVGATHTAGQPTPAQLVFTVSPEGKDLVYTASAVEWASAGHVELSIPTVYEGDGCAYAFPSTLFSYDVEVTDGAGGGDVGAGGGGSGGGPGAGGGDGGGEGE